MLKDFGKVIQVEFLLLILVALLTIVPINLDYLYIWDQKTVYVNLYFILSSIIVIFSNILTFFIFLKNRKINLKYYLIGMVIFIASFMFWIMRASGLLIKFDQMDSSGIFPSVIFAISIVMIQAFWNVTAFSIKK
jgi:hypothetical protein